MSDQRTLRWKSGGLFATALQGFWQLPTTLDAADPQILNLPLDAPSGGGTIAEGAASSLGATQATLTGTAVAAGAIDSRAGTDVAFQGGQVAAGAIESAASTGASLEGAALAAGAIDSAAGTDVVFQGDTAPVIAAGAASAAGDTLVELVGTAITTQRDTDAWQRAGERRKKQRETEDAEIEAIVRAMAPAILTRMRSRRFARPTQ